MSSQGCPSKQETWSQRKRAQVPSTQPERSPGQSVVINIREGDALIVPGAEFTGQLSTQTCAEVIVSASQSSGSGGRPLTI